MYVTSEVDLPEDLLDELDAGRLIVFAGAGVSMGAPSNLPSFEQLASQLAANVLEREPNEPLDRFLGRLDDQTHSVHARTAEILTRSDSRPTSLHYDILRLFGQGSAVRLVTTNFDRHFSTASAEVYAEDAEVYSAPALPIGRDVRGIVHLHGSVERQSERLVLTDRDFGRAYLTDGWATRFLKDLFSSYLVLFIGYSHSDPPMTYLARGLPPGTPRFALVPEGSERDWDYLGITPVPFPLISDGDEYRAVAEAIAEWARYANMRPLDHERRIKTIVEGGAFPRDVGKTLDVYPSSRRVGDTYVEHSDESYLKRQLRDPDHVKFFARYARDVEWLEWADDNGMFDPLCAWDGPVSKADEEIARWFASCFVWRCPEKAIDLVVRHNQRFHRVLWQAIAGELWQHDSQYDATVRAKWICLMLSWKPVGTASSYLDYILADCRWPEDRVTVLLLLEHLTRPRLALDRFTPNANVVCDGDAHWLKQAWDGILKPHLAEVHRDVVTIATSHLTQAHAFLCAWGQANERRDILSIRRSAIEPHEQDRHGDQIDVVIDVARDGLEWCLAHRLDQARALLDLWSASGVPLLRRLAVHGVTEHPQMLPDEKIAWVLGGDWLFNSGAKHEVFRLLEKAYPKATEQAKQRLAERVRVGPSGPEVEHLTEKTRHYEQYNLAYWLTQVAPACPLAYDLFNSLRQEHPAFRPREHPSFDMWSTGIVTVPPGAAAVEELLQRDPLRKEDLEWLLTYQPSQPMEPDREDFLIGVCNTVVESFDWGQRLGKGLMALEAWDADLWKPLLDGWQGPVHTEEQWAEVLGVLEEHQQPCLLAGSVAALLASGISEEAQQLPDDFLPRAEKLAGKLWDGCGTAMDAEQPGVWDADWLTKAINHPGGKLAQLWVSALSMRWHQAGDDWSGLPAYYRQYLGEIVRGQGITAQLARTVLASQLHFLFAVDREWARAGVLPLLDWMPDVIRAQQAWHGYLSLGRWSEALLPDLLPLFEKSFGRLATDLADKKDGFCGRLASIAVLGSVRPLEDGWLLRFVREADAESRRRWATHVGSAIRGLSDDAIRHLWDRWMGKYWHQRTQGIPLPLDHGEKEEMVLWALSLGPVFSEAVDRICADTAPPPKHSLFYRQLEEMDLAEQQAIAVARLIARLLSKTDRPFMDCREVEDLVRRLASSSGTRNDLLTVCNELARLDCSNALSLDALLADGGGD